jgi:DNA primase
MAGKIRASDIEEVKARINIADVIGDYVQLKTASVGSLKGLCPFHDEKSPSFNVRPSKGFTTALAVAKVAMSTSLYSS